jgi:hypothetical protein
MSHINPALLGVAVDVMMGKRIGVGICDL